MTRPAASRFVVVPSAGTLPVVFDTERQVCVEHGRRFQPAAARAEADRLNAAAFDCAVTGTSAPDPSRPSGLHLEAIHP